MNTEEKFERLRDTQEKLKVSLVENRALIIDYPVFKKYKAISSFSSEQRVCKEGEIYTAYEYSDDSIKFVFENGEMNFTKELFFRTMDAWSDVLEEVS